MLSELDWNALLAAISAWSVDSSTSNYSFRSSEKLSAEVILKGIPQV
jgi:hypothetical protein